MTMHSQNHIKFFGNIYHSMNNSVRYDEKSTQGFMQSTRYILVRL
jgi:hypothetical protein